MPLVLVPASRAFVDLRANGIGGLIRHDLTLVSPLDACVVGGVAEQGPVETPVEASLQAASLEPAEELSAADRERMLDNLRGREVLDAARWPKLTFRGRFVGTAESGTLAGDLVVCGEARAVSFAVSIARRDGQLHAHGTWEGTLRALGLKPYRALFGALRLEDWARLRLDVVFALT